MTDPLHDPWLKFYPADWQADQAVQMCSLAARGLWLEMILYMHRAVPYGHLLINGVAPTDEDLVRLLRPKAPRELREALAELKRRAVFSVTEAGVIYCRRMVRRGARDATTSRLTASRINGRLGGRPKGANLENLGTQGNLDGNLDDNLDHNLAITRRDKPTLASGSYVLDQQQQPKPKKPRNNLNGHSKRPIFSGQRFTAFEWFLGKAEQILGNHLQSFDIHAWFYDLDAQAVHANLVIPPRDNGAWLAAQLVAEATARGLPIAGASPAPDHYAAFPRAWPCAKCGRVHEGTRDQERRRECLTPSIEGRES